MSRWLFRVIARILRCQSAAVALVALALSAAPLLAVGPGDGPGSGGGGGPGPGGGGQPTPTTPPVSPGDVPEINPSAAVSALVLLVGGTLLLTDRMRRRNSLQTDPST